MEFGPSRMTMALPEMYAYAGVLDPLGNDR